MKNSSIAFLLFFAISGSCYSQSGVSYKKNILGRWRSIQDSNYILVIKPSTILELYKGTNDIDTLKYYISNKNCGIKYSLCKKNCFYLVKSNISTGEHFCYLIRNLSNEYLTLVYEGGTILEFSKLTKGNR